MKKRRWGFGVVGVLVLLFAGLVYAWSVLAGPISAFFPEWSSTQLSFTFTLCIMFFCLGGLISGILSNKVGPKIMLKLSALFFVAGFFIASRADNIITLYIGYGIIAGLASGFAYNSILGNVTKFFPDCPGLISGILLMGFGFGSFIIGKVYQAVTPSEAGNAAWKTSFLVFGIVLFIVMFISSFFIRKPTEDELEEIRKDMSSSEDNEKNDVINMAPGKMIQRKSFWMFFIWATLLSAAGLAIVSQATGVVKEVKPNISAGTISTVVGLISIFNGLGRIIFGGLFDKIGRVKTMLLNDIVFLMAIIVIILALISSNFILIIIGFMLIGIAYGAVTPTNAAFVNSFYGSRNYAVNLSVINMNLLIASFGSTIAGALYDASGSYISTLIAMLTALAFGFIFSLMIKRP